MENLEPRERLKKLEAHESMNLYKIIDGKKTSKIYMLNEFKLYLITSGFSLNTVKSYMSQVIQLMRKGKKKRDKRDVINEDGPTISTKEIEFFLRGKTSINPYSAIKVFLKFCKITFNQEFEDFDMPKKVKKEEKVIEVLTEEQIYAVAEKMPEDMRFLTIFLYKTGCRISEPLGAKVGDITWEAVNEDKENYTLLKISKTKGKKERLIPLNPKFTEELREYLKSNNRRLGSNYIFDFNTDYYLQKKKRKRRYSGTGAFLRNDKEVIDYKEKFFWALYVDFIRKRFEIAFTAACKKVFGKLYSSHILRRSRATNLLRNGVRILGVRDFMGHKSLKTTERYITESIEELTQELKDKDL